MNKALEIVSESVANSIVIPIKIPGNNLISESEIEVAEQSNGSSPSFGTKAFSKKTGSFFIYSPSRPYSKYFLWHKRFKKFLTSESFQ
jgi:hypothetical protein